MNKIQPGKYSAKIVDYGVGETKSGNLQVLVLLEYQDQDEYRHEITWFGSLKEGKAREITLETLMKCGLRGNDITMLGEGVNSALLDVESPVTIAVIEHEYEGNKSMRVQYISRYSVGALEKRLPGTDARAKLAAMNLKGAVLYAREQSGIKDAPKKGPADDDFDKAFGPI